MHVRNFDEVAVAYQQLRAIEARIMTIETLPLELNTPNPAFTGEKGTDVLPLEQFLDMHVDDLHAIVRAAIVAEMQRRHGEGVAWLESMGLRFGADEPGQIAELSANVLLLPGPRARKAARRQAGKNTRQRGKAA